MDARSGPPEGHPSKWTSDRDSGADDPEMRPHDKTSVRLPTLCTKNGNERGKGSPAKGYKMDAAGTSGTSGDPATQRTPAVHPEPAPLHDRAGDGGGGLRPPHVASEQLGPASGLSLRLRPIWVLSKPGKEDEKKTGNQERAAPSGQVMAREPVEPRTTRLPARARIHRPKKQRARRRGVAHHRTRGKGNESHPTQIKWGQAP